MKQSTYQFKGLDVRTNPLLRDPASASDLQNVNLNSKRELQKRLGFDELLTPGTVGNELITFVGGNKLIKQEAAALTDISSGTEVDINNAGTAPAWSGKIDHAEYNNVLYITDVEGEEELYKYDNYAVYRAGIPAPVLTGMTGVGYWYRFFYEFIDGQGNSFFGDYFQTQSDAATNLAYTYPTSEGFYYKYGKSSGIQTISSANLTLNLDATLSNNYVIGDFVRMWNSSKNPVMVEIEARTATSLTFTAASVGTASFTYAVGDSVELRVYLHMYVSDNETYGYMFTPPTPLNDYNFSVSRNVLTLGTPSTSNLEDRYDTTIVKGLPPKCKYITFLNNIMILANKAISDTSNQDEEDSFYWSDLSVGSYVETFAPFATERLGKTSEGEITGCNGNIILKRNTPYQIIGNLPLRSYGLKSLDSSGIGCVSANSIINFDGGCIFLSSRGVYWTGDGKRPVELTDKIEPLFTEDTTGLIFEDAVGFNDSKNEKIWIFVPSAIVANSVVFVFDYYHKEFFIYKGINAVNGIAVYNNDVYYADDTKIHKRSATYNDDGTAIDAYYATEWQNMGEPSLKKKFVRFIILALKSTAWVCNLVTQKNWKEVNDTDTSITITADNVVMDKSLNVTQAYSMRFIMRNNVLNEGLDVTGYEYEYEPSQLKPKGDV